MSKTKRKKAQPFRDHADLALTSVSFLVGKVDLD
jgi:hypothetical protein